MPQIYLDYNASTPIDPVVADAMKPFLSDIFGNPSSIHSQGVKAKEAIEKARRNVAKMIHSQSDEIIFTSGGTESNNYAIKGIAFANRHKGNHIITSSVEHPSVIEVCKYLEKNGFLITFLPVDNEGCVVLSELQQHITPSTILISVMHANNETGAVQPVNEIGKIARQYGIPFHTDASQSCGKIPVNVEEMQAGLLTIAGHKCYAPKGVGALYLRRGIVLEKLIHGADHEQNLRAGTENVASIVGLGKASELSEDFIQDSEGVYNGNINSTGRKSVKELRDQLYHALLAELPEIKLNGPVENRLPNTLNISFPGVEANLLLDSMVDIAASAGAACHSGSITASSVLKAMGVPDYYAMGTIRFSLGRMTTADEIERAVPMIILAYRNLSQGRTSLTDGVQPVTDIKLTHYTHGLGCACKIRPQILEQLLKDIPFSFDPNVKVGLGTSDDAAVYQIDNTTAIVQTVDFIPPVVDDPYHFGAIAAANSLSDIYAMGGTPLFALSIVGFPINLLPLEVLQLILKGASDKVAEAGINIIGGHTIEDTEPKFGLVVTGRIHPEKILTNSNAKSGDAIILTKPIGTGILSTGIKRGMVNNEDQKRMIHSMEQLNKSTTEIMSHFPVNSCTDVTGFGLLGHLKEMVKGSGVGVRIGVENVPVFPGVWDLATAGIVPGGTLSNLQFAEEITVWDPDIPEVAKIILADAQTSGGLLISVPGKNAGKMLKELQNAGVTEAVLIGYFQEGTTTINVTRKITS
jgi:cysteine desulfurase